MFVLLFAAFVLSVYRFPRAFNIFFVLLFASFDPSTFRLSVTVDIYVCFFVYFATFIFRSVSYICILVRLVNL